ncbi:TPA: [FeFe] hydrogenase H-cluster maturation GTPase HydF [Candidatus Galligastranaerophilus intestinigallinarum]|nr:[FeFe] hydrogenase H-cluster maturation GTPase HydF [Candidatus Galligastranaerophilus intestinigallinarum]
MLSTTKGLRLHIGFFGKRNAGKSSLVNKIIGQELSVVSNVKGTTTDVNQKSMELLPVGPVTLLDTAGIDDIGELGSLRVEKTKKALLRCDVVVFVSDFEPLTEIEKNFLSEIKNKNIPIISVINKNDLGQINPLDFEFLVQNANVVLNTSAIKKDNFVVEFISSLIKIVPDEFVNSKIIMSDIVHENETAVLVIPIDKEAPKGRIILPQVNAIREMLDNNSISIVVTPDKLKQAIDNQKIKPKLVVCDSQAFKEVAEIVPDDIMLTSFSILFARLKGDLKTLYLGAEKIDKLKDDDTILILESCSHHPVEDDIGRVKIPKLLRAYTNKKLNFEHYSGHDFPTSIEKYSLIIHCGACMTTRREVLNRINIAKENNVEITNYGITIAKCLGILKRAIKPVLEV